MNHDESTIRTEIALPTRALKYLRLELRKGSTVFRKPFTDEVTEFQLGATPDLKWTASWQENGQFLFHGFEKSIPEIRVLLEEQFSLGPYQARVIDTRVQLPFALVLHRGHEEESRWEFGSGCYLLGRAGKRKNHLTLNDRSISREHASLHIDGDRAALICDSDSGLSAVDGQPLVCGERRDLNPGARIQLGAYAGYWIKVEETKPSERTLFSLGLFGSFCLRRLDHSPNRAIEIRTEKAKQLLAWLALQRSRSLATQRIFEEFWPEREPLRQRKNLSHVLKSLQSELKLDDHLFSQMIQRTTETLALNPEFFPKVDVWQLRETAQGDPATVAELHRATLLPEILTNWARTARHELFLSWLRLLLKTEFSEQQKRELLGRVTTLLREGDFEEFVYPVAFRLAEQFRDKESIQLWYLEYCHNLKRKLSDAPSKTLNQNYLDVLAMIGTTSESLES